MYAAGSIGASIAIDGGIDVVAASSAPMTSVRAGMVTGIVVVAFAAVSGGIAGAGRPCPNAVLQARYGVSSYRTTCRALNPTSPMVNNLEDEWLRGSPSHVALGR